jgi:hypothetical protein
MKQITTQESRALERATLHLNAQAWGVSVGFVCGITIFIATIIAVLSGNELPGHPLGALALYLPGYRVSVAGAFIGFVYLFVIGYALGRLIGVVYNFVAAPRRG